MYISNHWLYINLYWCHLNVYCIIIIQNVYKHLTFFSLHYLLKNLLKLFFNIQTFQEKHFKTIFE